VENLLWILPPLICPLGTLLMGAVVWVATKLGLRSPEPGDGSPAERGMHGDTILPEQRPSGLERA
jgi:hypothetical protein